jgi:glycosyltransferase involved in cell wall biosynthesis
LIASDLPVVRELVGDGVEARLVPADRPAELARAIRILLAYPERAGELGRNGMARIEKELTWDRSLDKLRAIYDELACVPAMAPRAAFA